MISELTCVWGFAGVAFNGHGEVRRCVCVSGRCTLFRPDGRDGKHRCAVSASPAAALLALRSQPGVVSRSSLCQSGARVRALFAPGAVRNARVAPRCAKVLGQCGHSEFQTPQPSDIADAQKASASQG